jgi:hypothetical protein
MKAPVENAGFPGKKQQEDHMDNQVEGTVKWFNEKKG